MSKSFRGPIFRCSFCGRSAEEVDSLISGPDVHICNYCVQSANEIIARHQKKAAITKQQNLIPPHKIKEELDNELKSYLDEDMKVYIRKLKDKESI